MAASEVRNLAQRSATAAKEIRALIADSDDLTLWEANSIMCYLSDAAGASLWPHDAAFQVEVIRWLNWDAHHFTSYGGTLYFENIIRPMIGLGEADA